MVTLSTPFHLETLIDQLAEALERTDMTQRDQLRYGALIKALRIEARNYRGMAA